MSRARSSSTGSGLFFQLFIAIAVANSSRRRGRNEYEIQARTSKLHWRIERSLLLITRRSVISVVVCDNESSVDRTDDGVDCTLAVSRYLRFRLACKKFNGLDW